MTYQPDPDRYDGRMPYRRCGASGLRLPALSLGLWHNFGDDRPSETQRDIVLRAFDLGVTHFDLADNYGPPPGAAERNFGRLLARDLRAHRDELLLSTKAGYYMHPGPYGSGGSRKHLLQSLDGSLRSLGVDHVDIFYSHRFDPEVPLEETMSALAHAVHQGKACYVGVSSYSPAATRRARELLAEMGVPLLLHQPSYSMVNRWIESELLDTLGELELACIAFSPLAQGMLTDKYLGGEVPTGSRAAVRQSLREEWLHSETLARLRALNDLAGERGQTLAQLALTWALRDERITSLVIGASSVRQLESNLAALQAPELTGEELAAIDEYAVDLGDEIDIWARFRQQG